MAYFRLLEKNTPNIYYLKWYINKKRFLKYLVKPAQSYDLCPPGNLRASVFNVLWVDIDRVMHTDRVHLNYMCPNKGPV